MTHISRTVVTLSLLSLLAPGFNRLAQSQTPAAPGVSKKTFTISGNTGVAGAVMAGLPGEPVTDSRGAYSASVESGWVGLVMPSKEGYRFEPPARDYSPVAEDRKNEDYVARVLTFTISDTIAVGDEPIEGVRVTGQPGGESTLTDADGRYSMNVPYGWTGKLTFAKHDFEFDPSSVSYDSVTSDIVDGKSVPPGTATAIRRPRTTGRFSRAAAAESGGNVLVVPTKEVAPEQFTQIADDMRVMLNILREKLSEPRTIRGVLYDYGDFFGDTARAVEALYLQGYAAIFMLKADFPLSLPTPQGQAEMQKTEPGDPVWQRAKDRLYSPQNASPYGPSGMPREADQKSLDQLKEDLVKALKHAANIRNIDPNEWIILTVTEHSDRAFPGIRGAPYGFGGGGGAGGWMWGSGSGGAGGSGGGSGYGGAMMGGSFGGSSGGSFRMDSSVGTSSRMRGPASRAPQAPAAPASTTALTIQAKKGDIDAFSKGTLSLEQFQQRVKVFTY